MGLACGGWGDVRVGEGEVLPDLGSLGVGSVGLPFGWLEGFGWGRGVEGQYHFCV